MGEGEGGKLQIDDVVERKKDAVTFIYVNKYKGK